MDAVRKSSLRTIAARLSLGLLISALTLSAVWAIAVAVGVSGYGLTNLATLLVITSVLGLFFWVPAVVAVPLVKLIAPPPLESPPDGVVYPTLFVISPAWGRPALRDGIIHCTDAAITFIERDRAPATVPWDSIVRVDLSSARLAKRYPLLTIGTATATYSAVLFSARGELSRSEVVDFASLVRDRAALEPRD